MTKMTKHKNKLRPNNEEHKRNTWNRNL